jgi:hypothetical protein
MGILQHKNFNELFSLGREKNISFCITKGKQRLQAHASQWWRRSE